MTGDDNFLDDNDFEKLLNDFINGDTPEKSEKETEVNEVEISEEKKREAEKQAAALIDDNYVNIPNIEDTYMPNLDEPETTSEQEDFSSSAHTPEFYANQSELAQAKADYENQENQPMLGTDESELAQAFVNFSSSINNLCVARLHKEYNPKFKIESLYPNYKPSTGLILSDDLVDGWLLLSKMFPQDVGTFSLKSTDEQFLNFAEKLNNQDLQLAVISYVEIMIDMEACELSYTAKLLRYQEKHVKKILYEEYLARKERQRKFVTEIAKQDFPIDAELLVTNYFRVAQKDVDGAFRALTTNPAVFAPIDFKKLKPHFFGLIKVSPRDGIKMNIKIGNFLKSLRV